MNRSQFHYDGVFEFYLSRIEACPNYGARSGDEINQYIMACALNDSFLTDGEYGIILNKCYDQHNKFMEEKRNAGQENRFNRK